VIPRLSNIRVFAYCSPADMRKGFEGLAALVRNELSKDPTSGALYLFTNKRRTLAKALWFDGSGLCVLSKKLERGRFAALWEHTSKSTLPLKRSELELFFEGSDLVGRFQVSPPVLSTGELAPTE
jgi:transposase